MPIGELVFDPNESNAKGKGKRAAKPSQKAADNAKDAAGQGKQKGNESKEATERNKRKAEAVAKLANKKLMVDEDTYLVIDDDEDIPVCHQCDVEIQKSTKEYLVADGPICLQY